jgi:hypothetical protein
MCGLNLSELHGHIKRAQNEIKLVINETNENELYVHVDHYVYKMTLKTIPKNVMLLPREMQYDINITIDGIMFSEIDKRSDNVKFICEGDKLIVNDKVYQNNVDNRVLIRKRNDNIAEYNIKYQNLVPFLKCIKLCNNVELYMKNDFPITIKFPIGRLGVAHVFLQLNNPKFNTN